MYQNKIYPKKPLLEALHGSIIQVAVKYGQYGKHGRKVVYMPKSEEKPELISGMLDSVTRGLSLTLHLTVLNDENKPETIMLDVDKGYAYAEKILVSVLKDVGSILIEEIGMISYLNKSQIKDIFGLELTNFEAYCFNASANLILHASAAGECGENETIVRVKKDKVLEMCGEHALEEKYFMGIKKFMEKETKTTGVEKPTRFELTRTGINWIVTVIQ